MTHSSALPGTVTVQHCPDAKRRRALDELIDRLIAKANSTHPAPESVREERADPDTAA